MGTTTDLLAHTRGQKNNQQVELTLKNKKKQIPCCEAFDKAFVSVS